jgi:hypothetical protein
LLLTGKNIDSILWDAAQRRSSFALCSSTYGEAGDAVLNDTEVKLQLSMKPLLASDLWLPAKHLTAPKHQKPLRPFWANAHTLSDTPYIATTRSKVYKPVRLTI